MSGEGGTAFRVMGKGEGREGGEVVAWGFLTVSNSNLGKRR